MKLGIVAALFVLLSSPSPAVAQAIHYVKHFDTQALQYSQHGSVTGLAERDREQLGRCIEEVMK